MEVAIAPKLASEQEKLARALLELAAADSAFRSWTDPESGQTVIAGTGELHLDTKLGILKHTYKLDLDIGAPQVAYRETITQQVTKDYVHKKQSGGTGAFARVKIACAPLAADEGYVFENNAARDAVPAEFVPGIERGLRSVLGSGVLGGFPVVDLKVTLIDGAHHEVDSSALAFEIASRAALREALREAAPLLLEPIMKIEVMTPAECAAAVIRDLNSRRGRIQGQHRSDNAEIINALVPLATLFGYHNALRSLSGGATFAMAFSHYVPVGSPGDDEPFPPAIGMRA
jgi:elongation factor G